MECYSITLDRSITWTRTDGRTSLVVIDETLQSDERTVAVSAQLLNPFVADHSVMGIGFL
jgi:hypothetical protein